MAEEILPPPRDPFPRPNRKKEFTIAGVVIVALIFAGNVYNRVNTIGTRQRQYYVMGWGAAQKAEQVYRWTTPDKCITMADFFENPANQGQSMGSYRLDFLAGCQDSFNGKPNKYPDTPFPFATDTP